MRTPHVADLRSLRLLVALTATALLLLPATAAVAATGSDGCDDALVTFTRDGTTGDDTAVALTAQAVEQGVAGWDMITWQAASGTSLRAILVTLRNGEHVDLPPASTGTVEDVTAITFCGALSDAQDNADTDEAAVVVPEQPQAPAETGTDATETPGAAEQPETPTDASADTTPPSTGESTTTDTAETTTEPTEPTDVASPSADAEPAGGSSQPAASTTNTTTSNTTTTTTSSSTTSSSNTSSSGTPTPTNGSTATSDGSAASSTGDDSTDGDDEAEVLGVVIVASPDTEDEDADQEVEADSAAGSSATSSGSSAGLAAPDSPQDATSATEPEAAQLASSPWGDRGPLQQAWLLAAAIAAGIAAGATVIRYRATTASANADEHGEKL